MSLTQKGSFDFCRSTAPALLFFELPVPFPYTHSARASNCRYYILQAFPSMNIRRFNPNSTQYRFVLSEECPGGGTVLPPEGLTTISSFGMSFDGENLR